MKKSDLTEWDEQISRELTEISRRVKTGEEKTYTLAESKKMMRAELAKAKKTHSQKSRELSKQEETYVENQFVTV